MNRVSASVEPDGVAFRWLARRHGDVDLTRLELRSESRELDVVEVVLGREGLEGAVLNCSALLGLAEKRLDGLFENRAQISSFLRDAACARNARCGCRSRALAPRPCRRSGSSSRPRRPAPTGSSGW